MVARQVVLTPGIQSLIKKMDCLQICLLQGKTPRLGFQHARLVAFDWKRRRTNKNVLLIPVTGTNISIITNIDINFTRDLQLAWIGLSLMIFHCRTFGSIGTRLGIIGKIAFMRTCPRSECKYSTDYSKTIKDNILFSGPVYLRLDIQGDHFTAYYGEDGNSWSYLGEVSGISGGRNVILGANAMSSFLLPEERDFDVYFDYLHFEAIEPLDE